MVTEKPLFSWILKRYRAAQVALLILMLASIVLRILPLEFQKRIVNTAIADGNTPLLIRYCILFLLALIIAGGLKYVGNVAEKWIGLKLTEEIRNRLFTHVLTLPMGYFRHTAPGTVITALTAELSAVSFFLGGALVVPITSLLTFLLFLAYMVYLEPYLALITLIIYPFEVAIVPQLQKRMNQLNVRRIHVVRQMSNQIGESVAGIHEIHGNASFRLEANRFAAESAGLTEIVKRTFVLKYGVKFLNNIFQHLGPFFLFLVGGYLAIEGRFSLGALVAFLSAHEKLYDPWKEILEYYQNYQDANVRYRRVMAQFDRQPDFVLNGASPPAQQFAGNIRVQGLSYSIGSHVHLLSDVNMNVRHGELVALVGPSGSGKSTLAMLIGQQYRYRRGSIRIDHQELSDLNKRDISSNIGFVAQHPFIFSGTIRDNLCYSRRALREADASAHAQELPTTSELLDVVRQVGLTDDILRFGLHAKLAPDDENNLAAPIVELRRLLRREADASIQGLIESYDVHRYLAYGSIYENIVFGRPLDPAYGIDTVAGHPVFVDFLYAQGIYTQLVDLGFQIARATVQLLEGVQPEALFFTSNPMSLNEFDRYRDIVGHHNVQRGRPVWQEEDEKALLTLALRFVPGRHKMIALPAQLKRLLLAARNAFLAQIGNIDPSVCESDGAMGTVNHAAASINRPSAPFAFYCPNDLIYTAPIIENIVFGKAISDDPAERAELDGIVFKLLRTQKVTESIVAMGLGFDVGSKGDRLSGGQRQKLALARALLKYPSVLILDEATASLDNMSQAQIQRLLETQMRSKTTVIAVIHRLDLLPGYDQVVVLEGGRITESGTYDELIHRKGALYDLIQSH
ncbi:hypothetical protein DSCO28_71660 [Desulfosarcina ovata subsp. sediminis]|uniref:ABC transporter ATP-binding protein n=1 Tax=Desulfosarcina ovata subsp. sediminis TaxID=885957 RepID=A0A5K8A2S4_9BACT|nr:ABC transporter ATP-binding protein/permease [Desulfosarcina ovata]BBO86600.1 hypothetical protein DSCO28_71660 [Desulfosarcina ovata subsp. sediminis]